MGKATKGRKRPPKAKPQKSEDTALSDAIIQKYTGLADRLLNSGTADAADESDFDATEDEKTG